MQPLFHEVVADGDILGVGADMKLKAMLLRSHPQHAHISFQFFRLKPKLFGHNGGLGVGSLQIGSHVDQNTAIGLDILHSFEPPEKLPDPIRFKSPCQTVRAPLS